MLGHTDVVELREPSFLVSQKNSKRVKESGERNVHAFVEGVITELSGFRTYKSRGNIILGLAIPTDDMSSTIIKYNPHFDSSFYSLDNIDLSLIKAVHINSDGVIIGFY
ncbi:hypothetical protein [Alishewanella phage vB_AspM_Slicko01]|nr:hypothetical protein [Alishewanella phage vB_AspM_Slicko01]